MTYARENHNTRQKAETRKSELESQGIKVSEVKLQYDSKGLRIKLNGFYIEYYW